MREHAERGAAVIKVMVTGGRMTAGTAVDACQFSVGELRAAADEAHRRGLPITGHAHGRDGIVAAVEAGFDGVEHASFLTRRGLEPDPRVIDALAAAGTFVSTGIPGTVPGVQLPPVIAAMLGQGLELMRSMVDAGVRIVIGPDAGIAPHRPHYVMPYAVADSAQVMGNAQALSAATYHAAAACGLAGRKGRLAAGSTPTLSPSTAIPSPTSTLSTAGSRSSTTASARSKARYCPATGRTRAVAAGTLPAAFTRTAPAHAALPGCSGPRLPARAVRDIYPQRLPHRGAAWPSGRGRKQRHHPHERARQGCHEPGAGHALPPGQEFAAVSLVHRREQPVPCGVER